MEETKSPHLPNEIWLQVLQHLTVPDGLPWLWMACRPVCRVFRDYVEDFFRAKKLPETLIEFTFDHPDAAPESSDDDSLSLEPLSCVLMFDYILEDKSTAVFMAQDVESQDLDDLFDDEVPMIWDKIREYALAPNFELPQHTVQINEDLNDGPIPLVSVSPRTSELYCDWRALMSVFYGEERLYQSITNQWLQRQKAGAAELKRKLDRGELSPDQVLDQAINSISSGLTECRKNARRLRIQHDYKKARGISWNMVQDGDTAKEDDRLLELQMYRRLAEEQAEADEADGDYDSDEESEEMSENREEDNEEDEWEDLSDDE